MKKIDGVTLIGIVVCLAMVIGFAVFAITRTNEKPTAVDFYNEIVEQYYPNETEISYKTEAYINKPNTYYIIVMIPHERREYECKYENGKMQIKLIKVEGLL